ncbi:Down syndrome cell adhesion molecule-like protein Dscam2, partial [Pollicipes pollicipes]|uniref:Down syndrome cell adhesion molecule-like protein Dscam2 n=1 Tax=Pollicipes pollicipes TaxID=41117 RepID=UPI001885835E
MGLLFMEWSLLGLFSLLSLGSAEMTRQGPVFVLEPPNTIDFSNSTGTVVECAARGFPQPRVVWVRGDGQQVDDVPGLRQVFANGTINFLPFRAEDYRQEIHAQVYRCLATNSEGSVVSRDVHVRAAVTQPYDTDPGKKYVIVGNSGVLRCDVPSFVADFVRVQSWVDSSGATYFPSDRYDGKYLVLPSGELHIRDVTPEDGFKSFRCRTVHRLTGETQLSATEGRLVVSEPVASSAPSLPLESKSNTFAFSTGRALGLPCRGQAYPVPVFRWFKFD